MNISEKIFHLPFVDKELHLSQLQTSQIIQSFCDQSTRGELLLGMISGNILGALTKSYSTSILCSLFRKNILLNKALSAFAGCWMEAVGIQFVPQIFKEGSLGEQGFSGWVHLSLTMTLMKTLGYFKVSNPFLQHTVQDLTMIGFDRFCGVLGFIEPPSAGFSEAMMQAEVVSFQMSVSSVLLRSMVPCFSVMQVNQELNASSFVSPSSSLGAKSFFKFSDLFYPSSLVATTARAGEVRGVSLSKQEPWQVPKICFSKNFGFSQFNQRAVFPHRKKLAEFVEKRPLSELAMGEPAAKNSLLIPEYISYLLAWQKEINPYLKKMRMIYNAAGPDCITAALLGGRVAELFVIDLAHISAEKLSFYIDHWDQVDQTPYLPIPDIWKEAEPVSFNRYARAVRQGRFLRELNTRAQEGYWYIGTISTWGIERCIIIELKKMGVDPKTIVPPKLGSKYVELQYKWGMQGQEPADVSVVYYSEAAFPELMSQKKLPQVDIFYQKAVSDNMDSNTIPDVPRLIKPGGVVILGRKQKSLAEQKIREMENRMRLGRQFEAIDIPWHYSLTMHEYIELYAQERRLSEEAIEASNYWWQLYGARKK